MSSKIVVNENIRIDGVDYTLGQELGTIDSPIPLPTLAIMVSLGQAKVVTAGVPTSVGDRDAGVPTSVGDQALTEPNVPSEPPQLTNDSPLESFGVPERFVDLLSAQDPPILTKNDVVAYLESNDDLTPITGIGKTTSDRILSALGLA